MNETERNPRRWLYPVLFVSLALNLLIAGIVVGWAASHRDDRRPDYGAVRGLVGEPFLKALPDDQRRAMMQDVLRDAPRIRESRESLRGRLEAFLAALRAEPYQSEVVAKLLKDQRDVALKRLDIGERLLLERLDSMTSEQRDDYANALERSFKRLRRPSD